jgi:hypothetical protein
MLPAGMHGTELAARILPTPDPRLLTAFFGKSGSRTFERNAVDSVRN